MCAEYKAGTGVHSKQKIFTKHPQVNQALDTWVSQAKHLGVVVTGQVIHMMWTRFSDLVSMPEKD